MLAGCGLTSGETREPAALQVPPPRHQHGDGENAAKMAAMCPMEVSGTVVAATDVEGGIGLSFKTTAGDVAELRRRVRRMAEMHDQPGGSNILGAGGMKMTPATASVEDIDGGARLVLQPKDAAQLGALREHVRMKAQRMAGGECPMMSMGGGREAAAATSRDAAQDTPHPGK